MPKNLNASSKEGGEKEEGREGEGDGEGECLGVAIYDRVPVSFFFL